MNDYERKQEIFNKINKKVKEALGFIESIRSKSYAKEKTLDKYKKGFDRFLKFRGVNELQTNLRNIESEPDIEGADTDYTLSEHSLVGDEYKVLYDYLEEIHDLIAEYRGS